jgi:hypothetical protein
VFDSQFGYGLKKGELPKVGQSIVDMHYYHRFDNKHLLNGLAKYDLEIIEGLTFRVEEEANIFDNYIERQVVASSQMDWFSYSNKMLTIIGEGHDYTSNYRPYVVAAFCYDGRTNGICKIAVKE